MPSPTDVYLAHQARLDREREQHQAALDKRHEHESRRVVNKARITPIAHNKRSRKPEVLAARRLQAYALKAMS